VIRPFSVERAESTAQGFVAPVRAASGGVLTEAVAANAVSRSASVAITHPAPLFMVRAGDDDAARAFHALHDASQIMRGEDLTDDEIHRARTLIHEATVDVAVLYQKLIRAQRETITSNHSLRGCAAGA
jgi:hypothetical protein